MLDDVVRRERILAQARADRAESLLHAVRIERDVDEDRLARRDAEIARLQQALQAQAGEIARLRQLNAELEAMVRRATLAQMLAGVVDAVDAAGRALGPAHALAGGSADLRVMLSPSAGGGLTVAGPAVTDPASLSSVRVDLRALPPAPAEEAARDAVEELRSALLDLQTALAGDLPKTLRPPADRALAVVALAAGPELTPASAPERAEAVLVALRPLARRRKRLAAAMAAARTALQTAHEPEGQVALAAALRLVAARVER